MSEFSLINDDRILLGLAPLNAELWEINQARRAIGLGELTSELIQVQHARMVLGREILLGWEDMTDAERRAKAAKQARDPGGEGGGRWVKMRPTKGDLDLVPSGKGGGDNGGAPASAKGTPKPNPMPTPNTLPKPKPKAPAKPPPRSPAERAAAATKVAHQLSDAAKGIEPEVTKTVTPIVEGGNGWMSGLKHRFKKPERIAQKLEKWERKHGDRAETQIDDFPDALRYTAVLPEETYAETLNKTLEALAKEGHKPTRVANYWADDDNYSGVNVNFMSPDGIPWEMQFHTEDSLARKRESWKLYEIVRDESLPMAQREEAYAKMMQLWEGIQQPKDWEDIGSLYSHNPDFDLEAEKKRILAKKKKEGR